MPEPKPPQRSRVIVLAVALAVLAGVVLLNYWPAASPTPGPSNPARDPRGPAATGGTTAAPLQVRLDDLKQPAPQPGGQERNPFRFYVKPPPPPPAPRPAAPPPRALQPGDEGYRPPPPPPPPPMPLKFIGTAEPQGKKKVAIFVFTDGRGVPMYAAEGELVAGQYKVVRIGLESVVMRYANGTGEQILPMRGQ